MTTTPSDQSLKLALLKMLPDLLDKGFEAGYVVWKPSWKSVLETEWMHVAWLVEQRLNGKDLFSYHLCLQDVYGLGGNNHWKRFHASWQQRTIALAKVKGVEV